MLFEREPLLATPLRVPETLQPDPNLILPSLTPETLTELAEAGWSKVGLLVTFVDTDGKLLMLEHKASAKNDAGALGPLGETSKSVSPVIEQPLETLFRGMQEEFTRNLPNDIELWMHQTSGWEINQWPVGKQFPDEFACGISFPVFVSDDVKEYLLSLSDGTEETTGRKFFLPPDEILNLPDETVRPGVKPWLNQLLETGLLHPQSRGQLQRVDFSHDFRAMLSDVHLRT